jgi:hypothetical protein
MVLVRGGQFSTGCTTLRRVGFQWT